ncbi:hypothetical protein U2F10_31420 [Leptothoe sp. EHU-05/26/07-4]
MNAWITEEQKAIAIRCIKNFYKGLEWADAFGICGGYTGNRNFHNVFQIDDDDILGIFDSRNAPAKKLAADYQNPASLAELIAVYKKRPVNIKTIIVLEKENRRLASGDTQGYQSKFLVDALLPAIRGIHTKWTKEYYGQPWQKSVWMPLDYLLLDMLPSKTLQNSNFLKELYHHPRKVDNLLLHSSLLQLFYQCESPFSKLDNMRESFSDSLVSV